MRGQDEQKLEKIDRQLLQLLAEKLEEVPADRDPLAARLLPAKKAIPKHDCFFYDLGPLALILQLPVISRLNIYQRPLSFFEIAAPCR